jgi:hypothetical protein
MLTTWIRLQQERLMTIEGDDIRSTSGVEPERQRRNTSAQLEVRHNGGVARAHPGPFALRLASWSEDPFTQVAGPSMGHNRRAARQTRGPSKRDTYSTPTRREGQLVSAHQGQAFGNRFQAPGGDLMEFRGDPETAEQAATSDNRKG